LEQSLTCSSPPIPARSKAVPPRTPRLSLPASRVVPAPTSNGHQRDERSPKPMSPAGVPTVWSRPSDLSFQRAEQGHAERYRWYLYTFLALSPPPKSFPPNHTVAPPIIAWTNCSSETITSASTDTRNHGRTTQTTVARPNLPCQEVKCGAPWRCLFHHIAVVPRAKAGRTRPSIAVWWVLRRVCRTLDEGGEGWRGVMPDTGSDRVYERSDKGIGETYLGGTR